MDDEPISSLLARAQAGDEGAVRALQGYEREIRLMVRVRLPEALRSQFDSMDFVQAVWTSFFRMYKEDPDRFADPESLRRFLAGMARNKVFEEHRKRTRTRKYDLGRERPLTIRRGDREVSHDPVAPEPTAAEQAEARERLAQLSAGPNPNEAQVIRLRLDGLTHAEIAEKTGLHERTVRRLIEAVRQRMEDRDRND